MVPIHTPHPFHAMPLPMPVSPFADLVPVGSVLPFAGALSSGGSEIGQTPIEALGWMSCDGRELKVQSYPHLFAALGYRYGGSDGTFNLPDYRGVFLRGVDDGKNRDPDVAERTPCGDGKAAEVGSLQQDALQTHEHIYKAAPSVAAAGPPGTAPGVPAGQPALTEQGPTSALAAPGEVRVSKKETRAINISINFVIKYTYVYGRQPHAMHC